MLPEIGKQLKIIRINYGETAKQMAEKLGISTAYLSAIENGSRNIPVDLYDSVVNGYGLSLTEQNSLKRAIAHSTTKMQINTDGMTVAKKEVLYNISKEELDDDVIEKINEVIQLAKKE